MDMKNQVAHKVKNVAVNIRRIREIKGYTQEYLAAKLKISQNAYSKIELGYSKITLIRLYAIANILEIGAMFLLTEDYRKLISSDFVS